MFQVSLGMFSLCGKSSQNSPIPVPIFLDNIYNVNTSLKVASHYLHRCWQDLTITMETSFI